MWASLPGTNMTVAQGRRFESFKFSEQITKKIILRRIFMIGYFTLQLRSVFKQ